MAGRVIRTTERKRVNGRVVERVKEETDGGILHWGRESGPDLEWFRAEIRKAYGGRAPKVLDPFAGGGAIPLEAMRLGCEVTAMDINPVAWFILKCTLEYPQKLAGQTRPLPGFALQDREFMEGLPEIEGVQGRPAAESARPHRTRRRRRRPARRSARQWPRHRRGPRLARARLGPVGAGEGAQGAGFLLPDVCRVRAPEGGPRDFEVRSPIRLLDVDEDGAPRVEPLNAGFDEDYLKDPLNPRWVAKPTVAYLWARTVTCKQCRAELPLLKTRWLCRKDRKRVLLTMELRADRTGVDFGVQSEVPQNGGNGAQRREHDRRLGGGHHVTHRGCVPLLRGDHDHGGCSSGRPRRTAGRGDDGRGRGWAQGEGVPPAHEPRAGRWRR